MDTVGPETVEQGQEGIEFTESNLTVTTPAEWATTISSLGATELRGFVKSLTIDAANMEPAKLNIATSQPFTIGLPYTTLFESGRAVTFTAPSEGRTFSFGPYKVTGTAGEQAKLSVDTAPGFRERSASSYESTGEGILFTVEGYNATGEQVLGETKVACTAPSGEQLWQAAIGQYPPRPSELPVVFSVEPDHGPTLGGTTVTIVGANFGSATAVEFGALQASSFTVNSSTSITAVTPGYSQCACGVPVVVRTPKGSSDTINQPGGTFYYELALPLPRIEHLTFSNWALAGSLTPKKLAQAITLPAGSTFNGSGELNTETGAGSLTGNISVPPFSATLKLLGFLPVSLGMTVTQAASLAGTIAASESVPGDETLTLPAKVNLGVTSVGLFGLKMPTSCATVEPISLGLADTLTREELVKTGWSFAGTTTLPRIACEGGVLGRLLGSVLTTLLSGPESAFAITVKAP
ncbi:MAG: IPT/TIG domain-containing protein [Solirubrobacteraceae bacterium]